MRHFRQITGHHFVYGWAERVYSVRNDRARKKEKKKTPIQTKHGSIHTAIDEHVVLSYQPEYPLQNQLGIYLTAIPDSLFQIWTTGGSSVDWIWGSRRVRHQTSCQWRLQEALNCIRRIARPAGSILLPVLVSVPPCNEAMGPSLFQAMPKPVCGFRPAIDLGVHETQAPASCGSN